MTALAFEGFNNYGSAADMTGRTGWLTWGIGAQGPTAYTFPSPDVSGLGKYLATSAVFFDLLVGTWGAHVTTGFVGQRVLVEPGRTTRIDFWDNAATPAAKQFSVLLSATSCGLQVLDGTGAVVATGPNNSFPLNTWFYLEVGFTVGSGGSVDVHVNGASVLTYAGSTQHTANAWVNGHRYFGIGGITFSLWLDDFYICDDAPGPDPMHPNDTFLGDVLVTGP